MTACLFALAASLAAQSGPPNTYLVHNLVSDLPGLADHQDANLQNPWGNGFGSTPFWIGNNGSGTSTLYDGYGNKSALTVTIPGGGAVTGVIFASGAAAFNVGGKPSSFLYCSEDGVISGWNGGSNAIVLADNSQSGAVYKGCALASTPAGPVIYAANFNSGKIDTWDGKMNANPLGASAFTNSSIPSGFAPFNVQLLGSYLYVTYAMQDSKKHDDVAGPGNGYVAIFDVTGNLMGNIVSKGPLNSPWGLAIAPANFGAFPGALLAGNFGDGKINAFNALTGAPLGTLGLVDGKGNAAALAGLWSLNFGSGASNEDTATLYFTAGIGGGPNNDPLESHGLLGSIQPVPTIKAGGVLNGASQAAGPISASSFVTIAGNALSAVSTAGAAAASSGVKVTVNGESATVVATGNTAVTFLVPADIPLGTAQIVVSNNGLASAPIAATVQADSLGFFTAGSANGASYIAAEHADGSVIAPAAVVKTGTAANAGETIALYGTGFGAASVLAIRPPSVFVGGIAATVTFAGMVAPGLYQINVTLPANLPAGDAEVIALLGNSASQAGVFLPIGQ
jgi:uncharacterized protein (TIGR03118 family)